MNRIITLLIAMAAVLMLSACDPNDLSQPVTYLEVNAHNISGTWELAEWNGTALAEGTYVYLDIVRNDRTYTMYQNLDTFKDVPHILTGSYFIETDPEYGAVIRGNYDHDSGDWAHRYIVRNLTENEMTWIAKDDETFVQKFVRVDSIPL
ncbi:MAG: lipocalin family protein [Bacteroidales bacterium]|nr:lipocalin family protein [Bacteroidales bacterium]